MKTQTLVSLVVVLLVGVLVLGGCTSVNNVPTSTLTPEATSAPTLTPTPTMTPTATATLIPTPTPIPIYTDLGKQINEIAGLLGWDIVLCDSGQIEEDLDRGIFLYREDTREFFCDLEGHMEEPVPNALPQYMLSISEVKDIPEFMENGYHFVIIKSMSIYFDNPSTYNADEMVRMLTYSAASSLEDLRNRVSTYAVLIRVWPLTTEELNKLKDKVVVGEGP